MTDSRLQREAQFHDKAFTNNTRASAGKFYKVAEKPKMFYHDQIRQNCKGKRVLEYGCGKGSYAFELARLGADVVAIDISKEGIEIAKRQAEEQELSAQLSFEVMNAENLNFPINHFDVICGSGILHHLDLEKALKELNRTLKPDGQAIFFEPLGHNFLINLYRRLTPQMRSEDEHPLLIGDLKFLSQYFRQSDFSYYNLFSLFAVPFRALLGFPILLRLLEGLDSLLFKIPYLQKQAWIVVAKFSYPLDT